mmetsp:Transcript_3557/g.8084  ORF Transcript_3557/g.8084 Transcript_3557/m.8084 type:complete len:265 (+) Transcript_3557:44-838(+)
MSHTTTLTYTIPHTIALLPIPPYYHPTIPPYHTQYHHPTISPISPTLPYHHPTTLLPYYRTSLLPYPTPYTTIPPPYTTTLSTQSLELTCPAKLPGLGVQSYQTWDCHSDLDCCDPATRDWDWDWDWGWGWGCLQSDCTPGDWPAGEFCGEGEGEGLGKELLSSRVMSLSWEAAVFSPEVCLMKACAAASFAMGMRLGAHEMLSTPMCSKNVIDSGSPLCSPDTSILMDGFAFRALRTAIWIIPPTPCTSRLSKGSAAMRFLSM